ncbi:hypothetical protein ACRQ5D_12415 [Mucilaginibacter sp. P25]|uniref:Addiction module protein n=1 Tax=Mucilaginibacter gossypii TaxID=551996 RepID=A0A1G8JSU8_9SPHI|nr:MULTISPECIES: hypothetical protein [Mucilaginibacter]QTE36568.1 hypothetical protein J3L18_26125 [Mucilaginibacter gossypii]RAV47353.1 hypothetical protein DIU36_29585 [Mucilaginibacter rubeus]SDI34252.1 hypothetical protein SAMN05192573_11934 [Mucilaginibacter gossypii]
MDIALKYKIVEKIIQSNDDNILNEINSLLGLSENDFWSDLPTPVQQAIDKAKNQLDQGKGTPHKEVMAKIQSRFLNK